MPNAPDNKPTDTTRPVESILGRRSIRRHHKDRMKRKAERIVVCIWRNRDPRVIRNMRINADNLTVCSCEMCGNPRRSELSKGRSRQTRQERRAIPIE